MKAYRKEVGGVERPEGISTCRGSSAEDGVHARLVPGSLKFSQDLHRIYLSSVGACSSHLSRLASSSTSVHIPENTWPFATTSPNT